MDDLDVEANWYDEFAGALETAAAEYRRAARLLRFAGRALPESELDQFREQLDTIAGRTIAATHIGAAFSDGKGSGLK